MKGSNADYKIRMSESLNAMRRTLLLSGDKEKADLIKRFQNCSDRPYKEISGLAAIHSTHTWEDTVVTGCDSKLRGKVVLLLAE
jgi:hypothetical protein